MERLETLSTGRLAGAWALYSLVVFSLTRYIETTGYPEVVAWVVAAMLGFFVLACMRDI